MPYRKSSGHDRATLDAVAPMRHHIVFDWIMTLLSAGLLSGAYIDGWAHTHGKVDSSFFTPWHALFYSGYLALAIYLVGYGCRQILRGTPWRQALPPGYGWSLVGTLLFWFGGVGDLVWHTLFGTEESVEALFSPTHLLLATGIWLIVSGPFRAGWQRPPNSTIGFIPQLPLLLSATFMFSIMTFIIQIAHPMSTHWIDGTMPTSGTKLYQIVGVTTFLWDSVLLMGYVLILLRRRHLPPGAFTILLTLNAIGMGFLIHHQPFPIGHLCARLVAGIIVDLLYYWLHPSAQRRLALRVFTFAVPVVVTATYMLAAHLTAGVWWNIHLWAGVIVLTGVVGVLCSYLWVPPLAPLDSSSES